MIGGPASGKSTLRYQYIKKNNLNKETFVIIEGDELIKNLFNNNYECNENIEYDNNGNTYTVFLNHLTNNKYSFILDSTNKYAISTIELVKYLESKGYTVVLSIIDIDIDTAIQRAYKRQKEIGRPVDLKYIHETYNILNSTISKLLDTDIKNIIIYNNINNPKTIYYRNNNNIILYDDSIMDKYNLCSSCNLIKFLIVILIILFIILIIYKDKKNNNKLLI
jgi:predicted ABC-type ATPase